MSFYKAFSEEEAKRIKQPTLSEIVGDTAACLQTVEGNLNSIKRGLLGPTPDDPDTGTEPATLEEKLQWNLRRAESILQIVEEINRRL